MFHKGGGAACAASVEGHFPENNIITAASLFDRRTWPNDTNDLAIENRLFCLLEWQSTMPTSPYFSRKDFVKAACALAANVPLLVTKCGSVRAQDCTYCWQTARQQAWAKTHFAVVQGAVVLCMIAQSQSSIERVNRILKLAVGDRRWSLKDEGLANELSDTDLSCTANSTFSSSSSGTDSGDSTSFGMDEEEELPQPEGDVQTNQNPIRKKTCQRIPKLATKRGFSYRG